MGCETEPNNRLGVWLTECPYDAANYSEIAGAGPDFRGVLVLEVAVDKVDVVCCPLNDLVDGDIADRDGLGILSDVFQEKLKSSGEDFDRGAAFSDARSRYMKQGVDAVWIDSGETPIMAVFDPAKIKICARLTCAEAEQLGELLENTPRMSGDRCVAEVAPHLEDVLSERLNKSPAARKRGPGF